jgi:hypothetical protein
MKKRLARLLGLWVFGLALPIWIWSISLLVAAPMKLLAILRPSTFPLTKDEPLMLAAVVVYALCLPLFMGWLFTKTVVAPRRFFGSWYFGEKNDGRGET